MSGTVDPAEASRRRWLAELASEAQGRGLQCRLTGPEGALLHLSSPSSGKATIVFAMPSSLDTWTYLWSGGGSASATDPSRAADLLAASLNH